MTKRKPRPPRPAIAFGAKTPDLQLPEAERYEVRSLKYPGLRLLVHPTGKKKWIFRYRFGPDQYNAPIGKWPGCTVAIAHAKAAEYLEQLADGKNPLHAPPPVLVDGVEPGDTRFEAMVASYKEMWITPEMKPGTQRYVLRELAAATEVFTKREIKGITRREIITYCNTAIKRGKAAHNQTIKTIAAFFAWCEDQGYIDLSPARHIRKSKVQKRKRVLSDGEVKALWAKADAVNGRYGALVKLLLLTGCRRNEIAKLEWSEVEEKNNIIKLPGTRTKNGEEHIVHLTPLMKSILATFERKGKYVLGRGDGTAMSASNWAKQQLDGALNAEWRFHDLRRTFRTGLSALRVREVIAETCIGHKKDVLTDNYNMHDYLAERAEAFEAWSAHIEKLTADNLTLGTASNEPVAELVS